MSTAARRPLIAGNWKMFKTHTEARPFVTGLWEAMQAAALGDHTPDVVVCPPFTALLSVAEQVQQLDASIAIAAQTMDAHDQGAYTGEIAPGMLTALGVSHVVLGHSERRQYFNETDDTVAEKTLAALRHGLTPIVCVGELLQERENGLADAVIEQQVRAVLNVVPVEHIARLVIAYEPVWAIGTGQVCDAGEAGRVCGLIRHYITEYNPQASTQVRILYGGSVKPDNTAQLLQQPDIDGGLVGGASLEVASFCGIIQQAALATAAPVSG